MPETPATPFRAALERAKAQREAARDIGAQLRAEDEQRAQGAPVQESAR